MTDDDTGGLTSHKPPLDETPNDLVIGTINEIHRAGHDDSSEERRRVRPSVGMRSGPRTSLRNSNKNGAPYAASEQ